MDSRADSSLPCCDQAFANMYEASRRALHRLAPYPYPLLKFPDTSLHLLFLTATYPIPNPTGNACSCR